MKKGCQSGSQQVCLPIVGVSSCQRRPGERGVKRPTCPVKLSHLYKARTISSGTANENRPDPISSRKSVFGGTRGNDGSVNPRFSPKLRIPTQFLLIPCPKHAHVSSAGGTDQFERERGMMEGTSALRFRQVFFSSLISLVSPCLQRYEQLILGI